MSKISIIGTVGVPACYGGFETLVENLLDETDTEQNITVYCSSHAYKDRERQYKNANRHFIPLNANGSQSVLYDIWSLIDASFKRSNNIVVLGVSGAIFLPFVRLISNARIITNIDGLEWKRSKWSTNAKRFLKFSEKMAVKYSDIIVADNKAIADYVKSEYNVNARIIAYGGDHAITKEPKLIDDNFALALCRIEPENNIAMILEGFRISNKRLKFIGNWDSSDYGRALKSKYQEIEHIDIIDPIYDLEQLFDMRESCSFYVHGHSAGGTNPSLVEMMHFGKNIVAFDCSYNRETTENSALFFVDSDDLIAKISHVDSLKFGGAMKEIAERRYTWQVVKQQYFDLFK